MRTGERGPVGAAAAEARGDDGSLGLGDLARRELLVEARDHPRVGGRVRDVGVTRDRRQAADHLRLDDLAVHLAAGARREDELALGARRVELRPGNLRPVAELRVAGPEVDAGGERLLRVVLRRVLAEDRPAPRPDRPQPELLGDLLGGERLQLRHLEPRAELGVLAAAGAGRRVEAEHDPELARRDAERRVRRDPLPEQRPQRPAALRAALPSQACGAAKYDSLTMSAYAATCCHQSAATSPM